MSFPLELITMFGSSVGGGVLGLFSNMVKARQAERTYVLQALSKKAEFVDSARRYENRGFSWTRRVISLVAVFFVIAFPKIVSVFMPDVAVHVAYSQAQSFWMLFSNEPQTVWKEMKGLVITPLDTHLLCAIVGLYFGGSIVK